MEADGIAPRKESLRHFFVDDANLKALGGIGLGEFATSDERTPANKEKAISYAAYHALTDLFPGDSEKIYKPMMRELGYDPEDKSIDIETQLELGTWRARLCWNFGIVTGRISWGMRKKVASSE